MKETIFIERNGLFCLFAYIVFNKTCDNIIIIIQFVGKLTTEKQSITSTWQ